MSKRIEISTPADLAAGIRRFTDAPNARAAAAPGSPARLQAELAELPVRELRRRAAEAGIAGRSRLRRSELVAALLAR